MIFLAFLFISLLITLGIRFDQIKENLLPYILIAIYASSILPSLQAPYMIDDIDHLFQLSQSIESSHVLQWIFTPHNEHVIPFLKLLYFIFYKNFWLYPQPFHLVIIAVCAGILCLAYHLLLRLTNSKYCAFLGITLLAATNLSDLAIYIITDSHILFCLFFTLLLFYAQYQYLSTKRKIWAVLIILSAVLAPATFSLGVTSLLFAFLFEWLCIPKELKKTNGSTMLIVFTGWALGLIPYLLSMGKIIYSDHYRDVTSSSAFEVMNIPEGTRLLLLYFCQNLIPELLPHFYLSLGLFFFAVATGIKYRKTIDWKAIAFFLISGFSYNFIIYIFRATWGPATLGVSRYDVFPSLMLCMIYVTLICPFIKEKEPVIKDQKFRFVIYLSAFVLISFSGMIRYNRAERVATESNATLQRFNIGFNLSVKNYFRDNPHIANLSLKNKLLFMPRIPSLTTRSRFNPDLTRHSRTPSFYAQYVLSADIREKVSFGETTDQSFLDYLREARHENIYGFLIPFFE